MSYSNQNQLKDIIQHPYRVDISQFLNRGWQIFSANAGGFIGFLCLMTVILCGLNFIPVVGLIVAGILVPMFQAGFFFVAFKISQGSPVQFGDFFKGFKNTYFLNLFLVNLVQNIFGGFLGLVSVVSFGLLLYNFLRRMFYLYLDSSFDLGEVSELPELPELPIPPILIPILLVLGLLSLFAIIYLGVSYTFTIPLVVDKKIGFWAALETSRQLITKKWWAFFAFSLVIFSINLVGFLVGFVGSILTIPFTINAIAAAYESIVGLSNDS
jgi:uncharacterized membrane protein